MHYRRTIYEQRWPGCEEKRENERKNSLQRDSRLFEKDLAVYEARKKRKMMKERERERAKTVDKHAQPLGEKQKEKRWTRERTKND